MDRAERLLVWRSRKAISGCHAALMAGGDAEGVLQGVAVPHVRPSCLPPPQPKPLRYHFWRCARRDAVLLKLHREVSVALADAVNRRGLEPGKSAHDRDAYATLAILPLVVSAPKSAVQPSSCSSACGTRLNAGARGRLLDAHIAQHRDRRRRNLDCRCRSVPRAAGELTARGRCLITWIGRFVAQNSPPWSRNFSEAWLVFGLGGSSGKCRADWRPGMLISQGSPASFASESGGGRA